MNQNEWIILDKNFQGKMNINMKHLLQKSIIIKAKIKLIEI